jgi:hypothetical protein
VGGACSMHGRDEKCKQSFGHKTLLEWILQNQVGNVWTRVI